MNGLVETWTTLLNCILYKRSLDKEKRFSAFQSAKLIRHLGYTSFCQFYNGKKILTDTNAFSYYILKSAFLFQIEEFKKDFPLNHIDTCNYVNAKMLLKYLENKEWIEFIDKNIKSYNRFPETWKLSMRMTYPKE